MKNKLVRFWGTPSNWAIFTYPLLKKIKSVVSKWLNKRETFWTDNNGHNHWGPARGISKTYWTMRNCRCVDKCYFHTQRKGASGHAKHDNMHVCVSFGTHSLCVCVYPCWSSIHIVSWKPWWKCVRMCRYWSSSSRGRLGYLSSHGVLQPKHTFFCLGLGCAYQSSKNIQPRVLSELSEWKITHCKGPSTWQELHCEWRCSTKKNLDNFECHTDGN